MSGATVGGVVGAIIGSFIPGVGTQLGFMLGSAIGGAIAPETIKAPGIGDAQRQTAQAGAPRPVVYGHPAPFAGNIIDGEAKARKVTRTTRQGKGGGPKVKEERFILTSAIRICEGPIAGVLRIWRNGEVVYDRRADVDMPEYSGGTLIDRARYMAEMRAKSMSFQNKVRIYLGTEDQMPDPALEAIHGVGNTPYYRGTAYIVVEDDDVTQSGGAAAQYQFEVLQSATEADVVVILESADTVRISYSGLYGMLHETTSLYTDWSALPVSSPLYVYSWAPVIRQPTHRRAVVETLSGTVLWDSGWISTAPDAAGLQAFLVSNSRPDLVGPVANSASSSTTLSAGIGSGDLVFRGYAVSLTPGEVAEVRISSKELVDPLDAFSTTPELPGAMIGGDGGIYYADWSPAQDIKTLSGDAVILASVVADIADRCGVPSAKLDVSTLNDVIPGLLIAQQFTGADCIRPTQQMFFYDLPEVDGQIVAVKRGGALALTITDDDLLEMGDDDEETRPQQIEFPGKVSVITQDPAAEYAAIPQTSIRTSPNVTATSEVTIQSPIPFGATDAKRRADIIHKVTFSQAEGRKEFALSEEFSGLVPSDCIGYDGKRWLIEQKEATEGENRFKCVYDRASAYSSAVTGAAPTPPVLPITTLRGPTVFVAMNLPQLRTQDSTPGLYVAAHGVLPGWVGCELYLSVDNGVTEQPVLTMTNPAVMGELTASATSSSEPMQVRVIGELESVSADQIAARANGFAIIGSAIEVGQFQTATLTAVDTSSGANSYDLTAVTRGQLETVAAAHAAGERFVLLDGAVYFLPIDVQHAGKTLIFRAVSLGTVPENNPTFSVVYDPPVFILDGGGA